MINNEIDNGHYVKPSDPRIKRASDFLSEKFDLSILDKCGLYTVIAKYLREILGKSYENKKNMVYYENYCVKIPF